MYAFPEPSSTLTMENEATSAYDSDGDPEYIHQKLESQPN